jgi:hypothetical protein
MRPVHVAVATPWTAFRRGGDTGEARWDMPDGVETGDTVVTLVHAHEWAVACVSVSGDGGGGLHDVDPYLPDGAALTAVERRVRVTVPRSPATLPARDAAALLAAIRAEAEAPTPWHDLDDTCDRVRDEDALRTTHLWGCRGCGRDTRRRYSPRFETHVVPRSPDDWLRDDAGAVGVCPSCHDILHQPLGPTVDELMFSNRPACPECGEHQAFSILRGFPPGPPPHGTRLYGCSITDMDMTRWVCGACETEW